MSVEKHLAYLIPDKSHQHRPSLALLSVIVVALGASMVPARAIAQEAPNKRLLDDALLGRTPQVQQDIAQGADVNARDSDGETPLIRAADNNRLDTALVLIEHGADVNAHENDGATALIQAAEDNYVDVIRLLLAHGADINAKDSDGETALDWAELLGSDDTVDLLQSNGAKE